MPEDSVSPSSMKINEASVRKPITTLLLFAAVVLFGLYSFQRLPVDLYPEIDPPYITLFTVYQGANAADIEQNVSKVLEDNLNTVATHIQVQHGDDPGAAPLNHGG